ncbi:MAG: hypothetical protein JNJ57_17410 [Saprospiraceae bacterium]|nr:hypothetical protein [Saprospiraceae bacterium]
MDPLHPSSPDFNAVENTLENNLISKEKHKRLFQRGIVCLGIGAALLVISFAINFLMFHSDQFSSVVMYALTTIGAVMMTKGMVDILGF